MTIKEKQKSEGFIDAPTVASILGVTEDTVRRWARSGKVLSRRIGKGGRNCPSVYVNSQSVADYLGGESHRLLGVEPPEDSLSAWTKLITAAADDLCLQGPQDRDILIDAMVKAFMLGRKSTYNYVTGGSQ